MVDEQWLEVKDIVERLNVHEQTVRRWIREGELPALMFSRRSGYRVRASDLAAFLEAQMIQGKAALVAA
jgi:excisionase family DNA binding protein